jgi:hypothetical protein
MGGELYRLLDRYGAGKADDREQSFQPRRGQDGYQTRQRGCLRYEGGILD